MRRPELQPIVALAAVGVCVALGVASCAQSDAIVAREVPAPTFASPDASADVSPAPAEVPMCPVTTCSRPWATCPSSEFPCDVNLLKDDDNCGGCGIRCGSAHSSNSKWTCIDGECRFSCSVNGWRNCDDNPTNGCETYTYGDANNCGECGKKCPAGFECNEGGCVDPCEAYGLPNMCDGTCTDLTTDDYNCGTCGTMCDPDGPNEPALPEGMYYGCAQGTCGHPKCSEYNKVDCNKDLSDGCEATLRTAEHCASCDDACPSGKVCGYTGQWRCLCDDGETFCGGFVQCRRLDDDPMNCGGCNRACPGIGLPHYAPTCSLGICGGACVPGYADCDGIKDNGCETNTRVDNRNCGGCGKACVPGQVCSEGQCLVAPCDPGEPGGSTK